MKKMKINGEDILAYEIEGEEQGYITEVKTLVEAYNTLKEQKENDKRYNIKDKYYINCRTKTAIYNGYELRRYKNKLHLK